MNPTRKIWSKKVGDVGIEVSIHAEGQPYAHEGKGIFCYYLYLYECYMSAEKFAELWLEDKLEQFSEGGTMHVTRDYYSLSILSDVDFHGGITYYEKYGHSVGHRYVKLGCYYNHLWDRDMFPSIEQVMQEAESSAQQADTWINGSKNNINEPTE